MLTIKLSKEQKFRPLAFIEEIKISGREYSTKSVMLEASWLGKATKTILETEGP